MEILVLHCLSLWCCPISQTYCFFFARHYLTDHYLKFLSEWKPNDSLDLAIGAYERRYWECALKADWWLLPMGYGLFLSLFHLRHSLYPKCRKCLFIVGTAVKACFFFCVPSTMALYRVESGTTHHWHNETLSPWDFLWNYTTNVILYTVKTCRKLKNRVWVCEAGILGLVWCIQ